VTYYEVNGLNQREVEILFTDISKLILEPLEPLPKLLPLAKYLDDKDQIMGLHWGSNIQS